jgi:predicted nicotinamide N-methyase
MSTSPFPWPLERTTFPLGSHTVTLDRVADQDALLEALLAKGSDHPDVRDERVPYWGDLWPSGLGLARHLLETDALRGLQRVHEIGCGIALPGIVSGFAVPEVILSDYLEDALQLARHNWALNHTQMVRTAQLDWREPDPLLAADLLLASDVAYEARSFGPLVKAFRTLCRPGGRILLAEPGRDRARPWLENLGNEGFDVKVSQVQVNLRGLASSVNVLELHPK